MLRASGHPCTIILLQSPGKSHPCSATAISLTPTSTPSFFVANSSHLGLADGLVTHNLETVPERSSANHIETILASGVSSSPLKKRAVWKKLSILWAVDGSSLMSRYSSSQKDSSPILSPERGRMECHSSFNRLASAGLMPNALATAMSGLSSPSKIIDRKST